MPFKAGTRTNLVIYKDAHPHVLEAQVVSEEPFVLTTDCPAAGKLARQRRALLVSTVNGAVYRVETEITTVEADQNSFKFTMIASHWDEIDRRRYPRYEAGVPVTVRAVAQIGDEVCHLELPGSTVDLSLGGASLNFKGDVAEGSLVELQLNLSANEIVRVLSVVAFSGPSQERLGLEFVDFIGGARYHIHSYLSKVAA